MDLTGETLSLKPLRSMTQTARFRPRPVPNTTANRLGPTTPFMAVALSFALLLTACDKGPAEVSVDSEPTPDPEESYQVVDLVTGLAHPWGLAFLPDGDILITERPGRVRLVREGELRSAPVQGAPSVAAVGQGGMLDIALHPQFEQNRWVYLSYAASV